MGQERLARRVLGVSENADMAKIQKAFRGLAMKYHPDRNPGNEKALQRLKRVINAYEFLKGNEDLVVLPDEGGAAERRIGNYHNTEWGFFCHWKETFMDDLVGNGREGEQ